MLGVPTGKAVVCGEVVHVPTSDGLISLDTLDGTIRGQQAVPASRPPLGNLACMNTGLYSLDPSSIRKFPDIERMHEAATALLSADPKNVTAAVQLAWAELLRGQPQRAHDAVAGFHENAKKHSAVARVTVEALLTLARQAPSPDEALRLLQKADESAVSAASRLRCRSEIANQLATLGRKLEAHRGLLTVGLSPDADEMIELDDGVTSVARLEITRRLHQLHDRLTADELRTVEADRSAIETSKQLAERPELPAMSFCTGRSAFPVGDRCPRLTNSPTGNDHGCSSGLSERMHPLRRRPDVTAASRARVNYTPS